MCRIRVNVYIDSNKSQAHTSAIIRYCFSHTATSLHWNRYIWFTILFIFDQHFQVQTSNSFPICIYIWLHCNIYLACTCTFLPTCGFNCWGEGLFMVFLWKCRTLSKDSYCVMGQNNINSINSFIFSENVFSTYF